MSADGNQVDEYDAEVSSPVPMGYQHHHQYFDPHQPQYEDGIIAPSSYYHPHHGCDAVTAIDNFSQLNLVEMEAGGGGAPPLMGRKSYRHTSPIHEDDYYTPYHHHQRGTSYYPTATPCGALPQHNMSPHPCMCCSSPSLHQSSCQMVASTSPPFQLYHHQVYPSTQPATQPSHTTSTSLGRQSSTASSCSSNRPSKRRTTRSTTTSNKSNSTTHVKIELCKHWTNGSCPYGERCTYKHGESDSADKVPQQPKAFRVVPCRHWYSGRQCPKGEKCAFRHDDDPIESTTPLANCCPTLLRTGSCTQSMCPYAHYAVLPSSASLPLNPTKYKTTLCAHFMVGGAGAGGCMYGTRCLFAHGEEELRS